MYILPPFLYFARFSKQQTLATAVFLLYLTGVILVVRALEDVNSSNGHQLPYGRRFLLLPLGCSWAFTICLK